MVVIIGEIGDEDLVVLLSERAALEIYKKWLDTLHVSRCSIAKYNTMSLYTYFPQAKRIGYRVQSEINMTRGM